MKKHPRFVLTITITLLILFGTLPGNIYGGNTPVAPPGNGTVSEERLAKLSRGINLSHWFAQAPINSSRLKYYYSAEDMKLIKGLGFEHVRLPLNPQVLFNENNPELLNSQHLKYLDDALDLITSHDLAVIVDLHPEDDFMQRLACDTSFTPLVARFWQSLAVHLSSRDPNMIFLEELNEPRFNNPEQWTGIQKQLIEAIRRGAPEHTIIANGDYWSGINGLTQIQPLEDKNIVYNFHFYEPFIFTHQGATWGWDIVESCKNIPYPSNTQAVQPYLPRVNPEARKYVEYYGQEEWDSYKIEKRILTAVEWAKKHNVNLTCNEFGVYKAVAPEYDRNRWTQEVRSIFEKFGIGWSMWDYSHGFGLVNDHTYRRTVDTKLAHSLGLDGDKPKHPAFRYTAVVNRGDAATE